MPRRSLEFEVGFDGTVSWPEGRLELSASVIEELRKVPPLTTVLLEGPYERVDARTRVLKVARGVKLIRSPLERALEALAAQEHLEWRQQAPAAQFRPEGRQQLKPEDRLQKQLSEVLRHLLPAIPEDGTSIAASLRAALAAHEARHDDAARELCAALDLQPSLKSSGPLAFAWKRTPRPALSPAQRTALTKLIWDTRTNFHHWPWASFAHEAVCAAVNFLPPKVTRPHPFHFGGPRPRPAKAVVEQWVITKFLELGTAEERAELLRVAALLPDQLAHFVRAADARDDRLEADAYAAMVARLPADSEDSPPDSSGSTHDQERDTLVYQLARFRTDWWNPAIVESGPFLLPRLSAARRGPKDALAFVLALDAVLILSELQPTAVPRFRRVIFEAPRWDAGLAIVALEEGSFAALLAREGAFGQWSFFEGTAHAVLERIPEAHRAAAALALGGG